MRWIKFANGSRVDLDKVLAVIIAKKSTGSDGQPRYVVRAALPLAIGSSRSPYDLSLAEFSTIEQAKDYVDKLFDT